ncbi:tetratricopeptide repeat protein [Streptomyces sp. NPDC004232]|uniref:tetratricopeptide repeat protein n=1 Tax=unclassified Streptomyces TaxID=2593676 RepID=UPI0033B2415C
MTAAEDQATRVRQMRTVRLGADHPCTIVISCGLARILAAAGRLEEAQLLAAQVLPAAVRVLGEHNVHTRRLRELAA